MKDGNFFYEQYNKLNWIKQKNNKINYSVMDFIIDNIFLKDKIENIKIFDIGFGTGNFFEKIENKINNFSKKNIIAGCEPAIKNYKFVKNKITKFKNIKLKISNKSFLETSFKNKFNYIAAIYVFPHFVVKDFSKIIKKIKIMLEKKGKFILVISKDLDLKNNEIVNDKKYNFINQEDFVFKGKKYKQFLHTTKIKNVGNIAGYRRSEQFYIDLFLKNDFSLIEKKYIKNNEFNSAVLVFSRK
ncbi:MAG: methyltransferase domain-containing protein [Patescibacteria group bacterium]